MHPRWKVLAAILTVTTLVAGGLFAWAQTDGVSFANALGFNQSAKLIGEPLPSFLLREVRSGKTVTDTQLRGRVVVVAFWATWCPFCQKMLPALEKIHADPALRDRVAVTTIDVREDEFFGHGAQEKAVRAYLESNNYTFPVLLGGPNVMAAYRVQAIPVVIVADPKGVVRYAGITEHSEKDLRHAIALAADE